MLYFEKIHGKTGKRVVVRVTLRLATDVTGLFPSISKQFLVISRPGSLWTSVGPLTGHGGCRQAVGAVGAVGRPWGPSAGRGGGMGQGEIDVTG